MKKLLRLRMAFATAALAAGALSFQAKAQDLPAPVKGASVEGITEYTLDNGMKVLLFPDQTQQTVTVNITYMVGSRHEGYGETGMAHLLEHMVFKGSPKHKDIPKELSDHGARPNGTTWLDRTNYFETFNATEENLKWALDLESDRMVNSFIKKEDLESEFTVVRNEFEMGENNPNSVLMDRIISAGYLWHNYGNSTIGSREDIERVPIDKLQAFYHKYYQPDNAILIVAGKIDPEKTLTLVNEYFGGIPKPERELAPTYTREPAQDTEREVVLQRVGDVQFLGAMYHVPPGTHKDYPAMDVLTDVMASEPSGPLYKALVDGKLASAQFGFVRALKEPGYAYFGAVVAKDKSLDSAKTVFLATLDSAQTRTFTEEEVNRAKSQTAKYFDQVSRNSEAFAKLLSEFIAMGDWRTFFLFRDGVEKVTPEDVSRVAKYYFKPTNRTVGEFIPTSTPDRVHVPEAPDVAELVKDYKGREEISQGEVFEASPDNIENRTHKGELKNGLKYAFLSKGTRGETVNGQLTLHIGTKESLSNLGVVDNMTAQMLMMGSESFSRQEIKDKLNALKSSVSINGGGSVVNVNINSTRKSLPEVLAIVEDVLKNPTFDENELQNLKEEERAGLESQQSEPMALAGRLYSKTMSPYPKGDVRYVPSISEQLEFLSAVKVEDLKAFHKKMYGASHAEFSLVGDFDENEVKKDIESRFGNWKNPSAYKRMADDFVVNPVKSEKIETPDKANALFLSGINLKINDENKDYPSLMVGNYLLGGGFLNSRLAVRIRQKEGISYGVGSQVSVPSLDEDGRFTTYAIYAPENSEKLVSAFLEEINRVRNEGFTQEELDKAKEGILQGRQVHWSKDNELVGELNDNLFIGRTMKYADDFNKKLESLTLDEVNNTFRKYIEPSKLTIIQAGDFSKKFSDNTTSEEKPASGSVSGAE
ncbi:insulinase family protein [Marinilongibacter aquaticus]|uniref:M16 family metallopeptidase n=1 Tax=Marinilongibacter aquaticus TaxID=2975157 RepID=UPI0021BDD3D7|nr:pitrilysin family protein [Marinilongibacter aquaticus]UBM60211.1 insulinase family protein [Marinilongibacter aquaticus]